MDDGSTLLNDRNVGEFYRVFRKEHLFAWLKIEKLRCLWLFWEIFLIKSCVFMENMDFRKGGFVEKSTFWLTKREFCIEFIFVGKKY